MSASPAESTNFFWHCFVAARMTDDIQESTVTKSYRLHAVRKATDCWAGRSGVQYASVAAYAQKSALATRWERCGLMKEHVIPVGVVNKFVQDELKASLASVGTIATLALSDEETQGLTPSVVASFQQNPRAWVVAQIVRKWTLHAWITKEENKEFDNKKRHGGISIRQRMPIGWTREDDLFARYHACGIEVSKI